MKRAELLAVVMHKLVLVLVQLLLLMLLMLMLLLVVVPFVEGWMCVGVWG
jgi:hypothetical protein